MYTCTDQRVALRKDNVWWWKFYIFDYDIGRIAAEVYLYYSCAYNGECCSSVIKKQISVL